MPVTKTKATPEPSTDLLLDRVRSALAGEPRVEEKKAFGGRMFMVRGQLCVSVRASRMMFRIDPGMHDQVLPRDGCRTMVMKGRAYRGYVHVDADAIQSKKNFDFWIGLALDFNRRTGATSAAPKKRRTR